MTCAKHIGSFMAPVLITLGLFVFVAIGCSPAAPTQQPSVAEAAPGIDTEALRTLVQEAVESAAAESTDPEEIRSMVEEAVAASSTPGVTAEEMQSSVERAVSEALAAQEAERSAAMQTEAKPTSIILTDIAGRTVTIDMPVERIILGEARQIYIAASLQPGNPFNKIVGWRSDLRQFDADTYNKYMEIYPEVGDIPEFGSPYSGDFSVEKAIALDTDVVTLNLGGLERAKEAGMIDQLAAVGIPVVVIDYRQFPLENTVPSTILLGRLFDQEERAQEIVDFYLQQVNKVYSVVDGIEKEKPVVLVDTAAGIQSAAECCRTYGRGNLGLMVERAGGINIGSGLLPGWSGSLNAEQVFVSDPDVIIATGSNWFTYNPEGDFVSMGYFTDPEDARMRLKALGEKRPGWTELRALKEGRHHVVWHQFYNSPYNFAVLQQFAKWFYPEEFADMDPVANFAEFHDRFLPISYSGTFFASAAE